MDPQCRLIFAERQTSAGIEDLMMFVVLHNNLPKQSVISACQRQPTACQPTSLLSGCMYGLLSILACIAKQMGTGANVVTV